jgi:hypothetical protein
MKRAQARKRWYEQPRRIRREVIDLTTLPAIVKRLTAPEQDAA